MSIISTVEPVREKRASKVAAVWGAGILLLVASLSLLFWSRLGRMESGLKAASQQIATLSTNQESLQADLKQAHQQTRAAEQRATNSDLARDQAVKDAAQAQASKTLANQQALAAEQRAQNANQQMEQMRKTREEELNQMQEALSKVANTRRTPDGMIIDLSDDSFKFDFDRATLRPENRELLSRLAGILLASHGYKLQIYGYTDDIGTNEYNQSLSQRRAQAVSEYLAKSGIPPDIMAARGFGKSTPRVKGTSPEARERNRRVEIGIVDTQIKYTGDAQ